ncbi:histidine phosphatase family protein [Cellulomonas fimi]|uniref:Histidine phosphatase family protein n=1 Tax=Cellulomonas fimi TaxID=1708 RepID=A0A7Y0QIX5_CELFI|nr:histidine phosphatase family protein [Cellulomonas fimi]NMR20762.1 histidine phosphatase family protein [Cellulomonas fimi]
MTGGAGAARRLVLLRHARAEQGGRDVDELRPLALEGRRQSTRVSAALVEHGLVPDLVLCSSAVRTRQTWELVRNGLGGAKPEAVVTDALYEAGPGDVLAQVREVDPGVRTLLVVGHEPTVSTLAALLAGPGSDDAGVARVRAGISTASFVVLEVDVDWSGLDRAGAVLRAVVSPKD